jgi:ATP-dependent RNA helicase SUPV3L1/SUV3
MNDGTFGVTGEAPPMDEEVVEAIESHSFTPLRKLQWRNAALDFGSADRLVASLEAPPGDERLVRAREADDLMALKTLAQGVEVRGRLRDARDVKLLWDVCRVPDFRGISHAEHASLLERIFGFLRDVGRVPDDWIGAHVQRIDRTEGDIDTLSKRLAYIRTWTYVAQRTGWVDDESHWRGATRAVEDRLSDALHSALTQRFVDRRTSVLLRRLKQKESLVAEVNDKGEVTVEGQHVGRLEGFRFRLDATDTAEEGKTLQSAAMASLRPEFHLRSDRFYNAPDTEIDFTEQGGLMWGANAVGKLVAGPEALKPQVVAFVDEEAGPEVAQKVQRRLQHFIDRKIVTLFEPLLAMGRDEAMTGLARGFAFRLVENLGIIRRDGIAQEVKELDQDARGALRKHGVRFGQFTVFLPLILKPAPTRLRLVLWSLSKGLQEFPESPPPGLVTVPAMKDGPEGHDTMAGYRIAGDRAIRIDMLERLADMLRQENSRGGFEARAEMLSITGLSLEQFAHLMEGLGYRAEKGERPKVRPVAAPAAPAAEAVAEPAGDAAGTVAEEAATEAERAPVTEDASAEVASPEVAPEAEAAPEPAEEPAPEAVAQADASAEATVEVEAPAEAPAEMPVEMEAFYTFTWGGTRGRREQGDRRGGRERQPREGQPREGQPHQGQPREGQGDRPRREAQGNRPEGKPRGDRPWEGKGKGDRPKGKDFKGKRPPREEGPRTFEAKPQPRKDRIDPDNPFAAALMGFRTKD